MPAVVFVAASVCQLSATVAMIFLSGLPAGGYLVWFALHYRLIHTHHLVDRAGNMETICAEDDDAGREC